MFTGRPRDSPILSWPKSAAASVTVSVAETGAASESVTEADQGTRNSSSLGRAGCAIVPDRPSGTAARPAQLRHRALHGVRDEICFPGSDAGRWCDAGALGRRSIPAAQKAGDEEIKNRGRSRSRNRNRFRFRSRMKRGASGTLREPSTSWSRGLKAPPTALRTPGLYTFSRTIILRLGHSQLRWLRDRFVPLRLRVCDVAMVRRRGVPLRLNLGMLRPAEAAAHATNRSSPARTSSA